MFTLDSLSVSASSRFSVFHLFLFCCKTEFFGFFNEDVS